MDLQLTRIDARLSALKLKDAEASGKTGMGRTLIRDLRRRAHGEKPLRVRSDTLDKLAFALQTSVHYLTGATHDPSRGLVRMQAIPVRDSDALVNGIRADREYPSIFPTLPVGPTAFAFLVTDNAMDAAHIEIGDLVIVDPATRPEPGDTVLAVIEAKVCLRHYRNPFSASILLVPLNQAFPQFDLRAADRSKIRGTVVEHRRSFTPRKRLAP